MEVQRQSLTVDKLLISIGELVGGWLELSTRMITRQ